MASPHASCVNAHVCVYESAFAFACARACTCVRASVRLYICMCTPGILTPAVTLLMLAIWNLLTWARANDCPWDVQVCLCAAMNGHLDEMGARKMDVCGTAAVCEYALSNKHGV